MAKRKKSATALFDVMTAGRRLDPIVTRSSRRLFQSPSFFSVFKRKPIVTDAIVPPRPRRARAMGIVQDRESIVAVADPATGTRKWSFKLPESFKFDPAVCIIAASGLVIVIGIFCLIERKFGREPVPTMAAVNVPAAKLPTTPAVLDLSHHSATAQPAPAMQAALPQPAALASGSQRVINMNYVLVQIYQDEKMAQDAADLLNKNGVACSVMKSVPHWTLSSRWYGVVGMQPFGPRASNTQAYRNYVDKIRAVSVEFAGKSKWKQFDPQLYQWRADSAAAEAK